MQQQEQLNQIFHALADPTRRKILLQVREQDETVNDIASHFQISLPAVSKHLKVLERSGLISRRKEGQKRFCHVEPRMMDNAVAWLEFYQRFWNDRLDNLKEFIERGNQLL